MPFFCLTNSGISKPKLMVCMRAAFHKKNDRNHENDETTNTTQTATNKEFSAGLAEITPTTEMTKPRGAWGAKHRFPKSYFGRARKKTINKKNTKTQVLRDCPAIVLRFSRDCPGIFLRLPWNLFMFDEGQTTHLICARLKYDLYDFFKGCFGPASCSFSCRKGPKNTP